MRSIGLLSAALAVMGVTAHPGAQSPPGRPESEPGFFFSFTRDFPGPTGGNLLGGGGLAFTYNGNQGEIAGTAQGGPTGPNKANGRLGGAIGTASADLHGAIGPQGAHGCAAFAVGSHGFTSCLSARAPAPTPPPMVEERGPQAGKGCISVGVNGKGFSTCLSRREAKPTPPPMLDERDPQQGSGCISVGVNGKGFKTCLSRRQAAPTA